MSGVCECVPWDSDVWLNSGGVLRDTRSSFGGPVAVRTSQSTLTRSHAPGGTACCTPRSHGAGTSDALRSIASPDTSGHREGAVKHRARFCLSPSGVVGLFVPASASPCYGVTVAAQSSGDQNSSALLSSHEATVMHAVRCCPEPRDVAHDRIARWRLSLVSRLRTAEFSPAGH